MKRKTVVHAITAILYIGMIKASIYLGYFGMQYETTAVAAQYSKYLALVLVETAQMFICAGMLLLLITKDPQ